MSLDAGLSDASTLPVNSSSSVANVTRTSTDVATDSTIVENSSAANGTAENTTGNASGQNSTAVLNATAAPYNAPDATFWDVFARTENNTCDVRPEQCCDVEEEYWGGLCYKTCALLTDGTKRVRKSPWTCCDESTYHAAPASVFGRPIDHCKGEFDSTVICNGFDVSGDGSCPHKPRACAAHEELHLGVCYRSCSNLTNGEYKFRSTNSTCCKEYTQLSCISANWSETVVGGGMNVNHSQPQTPHRTDPSGEGLKGFAELLVNREAKQRLRESSEPMPNFQPVMRTRQHDVETLKPVKPKQNDGKICGDAEELFEELCYRRCSLLTNGESHIRTSAFECCAEEPCPASRSHAKAPGIRLPCHGFDVSGDGSCPHEPGTCLLHEEWHRGLCYKQCGLMTMGQYPHRWSPVACCKLSGLGCLDPQNVKISQDFNVRARVGDLDRQQLVEGALTDATIS